MKNVKHTLSFFLFLTADLVLPLFFFFFSLDGYLSSHDIWLSNGWVIAPAGICTVLLLAFYGISAKNMLEQKPITVSTLASMYLPFLLLFLFNGINVESLFLYASMEVLALALSFGGVLLLLPFIIRSHKQDAKKDYESNRGVVGFFGGILVVWGLVLVLLFVQAFFQQSFEWWYLGILFIAYIIKVYPLIERRISAVRGYFETYYQGGIYR